MTETPREILKKIRHIELKTRGMVNTAFSGQYRSVFKGRGMNFEEVREYGTLEREPKASRLTFIGLGYRGVPR